MHAIQRRNGNEKEYLVCYTLNLIGYRTLSVNDENKIALWKSRYDVPADEDIDTTKKWLEIFDIAEEDNDNNNENTGTFELCCDSSGSSARKAATTADIIVYPNDKPRVMFSIKNNNLFLKNPCPSCFLQQSAIMCDNDFMEKYKYIESEWYEELVTKFGGRFPQKDEKMKYYNQINNLIKGFLITYDATDFIKFILDINESNADKYIIKYNKKTVSIFKIDLDLTQYTIHFPLIQNTFLQINLVHKKKKTNPIEIRLRLKNYEPYVRRRSQTLPIKYTVSIRNFNQFQCLKI